MDAAASCPGGMDPAELVSHDRDLRPGSGFEVGSNWPGHTPLERARQKPGRCHSPLENARRLEASKKTRSACLLGSN